MRFQKTVVSLTATLLFAAMPLWAETNTASSGNLVAPITDSTQWSLHNYGGDKVKVALLESEYPTAIKAKVDAVDDQAWHARIDCVATSALTDGEVYTLKFRAKGDAPGLISSYGQIADGDVHGIGLAGNEHLGTDWATYTETFIASKATGYKTRISINFGHQVGTVWLSSMSLAKGAISSIKEPVSSPTNWVIDQKLPAVAKAVPEADSIKFIISSISPQRWEVQAYQTGFMPVGGANYQVSFTAKADSPRPMDVAIVDMTVRQPVGFVNTIQLTMDWKVYTYVYNIPVGYRGLARLPNFMLGDKTGVVWIRNLSYTRVP